MQFQSTIHRRAKIYLASSLTFDLIVILVISISTSQAILSFAMLTIAYFALGVVWGVLSGLYTLILGWFSRDEEIAAYKREFRKAALPVTERCYESAAAYFQSVIDSETAPASARIYASSIQTVLAIVPSQSWIQALRMHARLETALQEYADESR
jgi:hypothetical protein